MLRAILAALITFTSCSLAQDGTALKALKFLPKDAAKRLARIEAREGEPWPERWYFLVHDPAVPLGLREYAVAEGALKANRTLSQFADSLKASDVIGAGAIRIDSDAVAKLAGQYAMANGARLGALNYELGKYGTGGAPAWRATVLDAKGDLLGVLIILAQTGAVERHDGFDITPAEAEPVVAKTTAVLAPPPKAAAVKPPLVKPDGVNTTPGDPLKPFLAAKPTPAPPVAKVVQRPTPAPEPAARPNALKRFGGSVKKLFGN